jgi:hypothetical protein
MLSVEWQVLQVTSQRVMGYLIKCPHRAYRRALRNLGYLGYLGLWSLLGLLGLLGYLS